MFKLSVQNGQQIVNHTSEQPEYHKEYILDTMLEFVEAKIFVIDDEEHCTMLLAEEY